VVTKKEREKIEAKYQASKTPYDDSIKQCILEIQRTQNHLERLKRAKIHYERQAEQYQSEKNNN